MKALLLLPLLMTFVSHGQNPTASTDGSSLVVLNFKVSRSRQNIEPPDTTNVAPQAELIPADKNFARSARVNDTRGAKDPHEDTVDARSAALEKIEQKSRTPTTKPVDGFSYRAKAQNAGGKAIEIVFWEYQFIDPANPSNVTRRQFLCGVNIKPNKEKELIAFSLLGPSDVVSVTSLANPENVLQEKVVINRVEYADGTIWQRKDWKFAEIRLTYQRAIATPWRSEMCRGL